MSVYLVKMEGQGRKPIPGRNDTIMVFESRNALIAGNDRHDAAVTECRDRLRTEVEEALGEKAVIIFRELVVRR